MKLRRAQFDFLLDAFSDGGVRVVENKRELRTAAVLMRHQLMVLKRGKPPQAVLTALGCRTSKALAIEMKMRMPTSATIVDVRRAIESLAPMQVEQYGLRPGPFALELQRILGDEAKFVVAIDFAELERDKKRWEGHVAVLYRSILWDASGELDLKTLELIGMTADPRTIKHKPPNLKLGRVPRFLGRALHRPVCLGVASRKQVERFMGCSDPHPRIRLDLLRAFTTTRPGFPDYVAVPDLAIVERR